MQQLNFNNKTKIEISIAFMQEHEPPEGYLLGYSGGKDSGVLRNIAIEAGVKFKTYYSLMPDPPELIKFIKTRPFEINIIRPEFTFWHGVETWFPPHRNGRWCCDYIKEKPSTKIPLTHRLLGIRAEEGPNRAKQGWINQRTKKRINYHPLFDWKEWEIWEYIEEYNLPYCSLYDEGFSRLGCVVCPLRGYKQMMQYKARWPQYYRLFEKSAYKWWERTGHHRQRVRGYAQLFDEFLDSWYRGK